MQQLVALSAPVLHDHQQWKQQIVEFAVDGELFDVPAGAVDMAAGLQYRKFENQYQLDALEHFVVDSNSCAIADEACGNDRVGEQKIGEAFVEFSIPLARDASWAKKLELSLGERYSHYDSFGSVNNGKIGLMWQLSDNWLLRSTYAQVFRAPNVEELYSGKTQTGGGFVDPCAGATPADTPYFDIACVNVPVDGSFSNTPKELSAIGGGNPDLKPEQGDTLTAGIVWSPPALNNFSIALDCYRISIDHTIASIGIQNILDQCFNYGYFCERLHRDSHGDWTEGQSWKDDPISNIGKLEAEGLDLRQKVDVGAGVLRLALDATYLTRQNYTPIANDSSTVVNNAGQFVDFNYGGNGAYPRIRANFSAALEVNHFEFVYALRYISQMYEPWDVADYCLSGTNAEDWETDCPAANAAYQRNNGRRKINSVTYHDLQFNYSVDDWHTRFTLGGENVLDRQPPFIYTSYTGTDERTYDTNGARWYLRLTITF